jgi:hypothetical protein
MAGRLFSTIPSSVALGIVEMQIQLATADIAAPKHAGWPMEELSYRRSIPL